MLPLGLQEPIRISQPEGCRHTRAGAWGRDLPKCVGSPGCGAAFRQCQNLEVGRGQGGGSGGMSSPF